MTDDLRDPRYTDPDTVSEGESWTDAAPECCERCGEEDISPNVEAWELSGETVCDLCAEEIIFENGPFGVGA